MYNFEFDPEVFNQDFDTMYNQLYTCHLRMLDHRDCEATINTHGQDYAAMSTYYNTNSDIYDGGLYNNLVCIAEAMEVDALMIKQLNANMRRRYY